MRACVAFWDGFRAFLELGRTWPNFGGCWPPLAEVLAELPGAVFSTKKGDDDVRDHAQIEADMRLRG